MPCAGSVTDCRCRKCSRREYAKGIRGEVVIRDLGNGWIIREDKAPGPSSALKNMRCMELAAGQGVPVPRVALTVNDAGVECLLMERLNPRSLGESLVSHPLSLAKSARMLGSLHAKIHLAPGPSFLPDCWEVMPTRLFGLDNDALREELKVRIKSLSREAVLLHGDFNPYNLLRTAGRGNWMVVDWNGASKGDRASDIAYTLVMFEQGRAISWVANALHRPLKYVRQMLICEYLVGYQSLSMVEIAAVAEWQDLWRSARARLRPWQGASPRGVNVCPS